VAAVCAAAQPGAAIAAEKPGGEAADTSATLVTSVQKFRADIQKNYPAAVKTHADPGARKKFRALDAALWRTMPPQAAWAYFFSASLVTVGNLGGGSPVAGFYNPWCDLYLVTAWRIERGAARMTDAEILVGDVARNRGKPPFELMPAWLVGEKFKPLAVGKAAAESILAFEKLFPANASLADWRAALPAIKDEKFLRKTNYPAASLKYFISAQNAYQLSAPYDGEKEIMGVLRGGVSQGIELAAGGEFDRLFAMADETEPSAQTALRKMPAEEFNGLRPVAYYLGPDGGVAFMVPENGAGYFMSFIVKHDRGQPAAEGGGLKRLDIVPYAGMYEYYATPGGAGK